MKNLRWYAAFHDKETNPHVHIVVYSVNPREGFLTRHGIEKIRSGFANDIYQDELHHLYAQQTDVRNQLKKLSADLMRKLSGQIAANRSPDAELVQLIAKLHQQLSNTKGKKVYGYLKPDVKKTVDAIFARLTQNADIQQMYKLWCEMEQAKHDVYSSAKVQFPALVDNPQFRSVKNMIVKTVVKMQMGQEYSPEQSQFTNMAFSLLVNLSRMLEEDYDSGHRTLQSQVDDKLRRAIRRKKQELGIKEEPSPTQKI